MLRYMLDTNICVRILRDRPSQAREQFGAQSGKLAISTVILMELLFGIAKSVRAEASRRALAQFTKHLAVIDYDRLAAEHTAEIRATLARAGTPIGPMDTLIAGHARSRGLTVVTGNLGEFTRVPGLTVENWPEIA